MKWRAKLDLMIVLMILIAALGALIGLPGWLVSTIIGWMIPILTGVVISGIISDSLESMGGGSLKNYLWSFDINGRRFSISLFFVVTIIIKLLLFR